MNIRMVGWTPILTAAFLFQTQPVAAASKSGDDLLTQCQISNNLAVIACHIYIHAIQDVLAENTVKGYRVCVPASTDIDQSVKVIVDWLMQHPEKRKHPASDLVAHALWETYPCKEKR
jgi:hypothetical protein